MCLVTRKPMAGLRRDDLRPFSPGDMQGYIPGFLVVWDPTEALDPGFSSQSASRSLVVCL